MKIKLASPEAYQLFHEGMVALSQIEANGIRVDIDYLDKTIAKTNKDIKRLESELMSMKEFRVWRKRFGDKTKLKAHAQLGTVVFEELGFKRGAAKKKKDAETREKELVDANDQGAFENVKSNFVTKWFEWQKLNKVASTYLGNIKREVEGEYLHPFFNLHTVKTYRGSADAPNFQNIPIRNPAMAEIIRSAFIARDGHVITENDFGGIEVRIGTCYHKDTMMIKYIKEGYDYHKEYAAKCYKLKPEDVTPAVRYCGKNMFVFPEFYGSYYADCCRNLWEACTKMKLTGPGGVPLRQHLQAQGIKGLGACEPKEKPRKGTFERHILETEDALWNLFHEYATWKDRWYRQYHQRGWFELKTGFVCHGLYSKNQSVNYPVQGAAFHCLLWVLIQLQKWLNKYKMKSKLVGQIHDSIIGDIHVKELDDYFAQVKYLVEVALPKHWPWIIVPMEIEAEMSSEGKSWFHKKKVQI